MPITPPLGRVVGRVAERGVASVPVAGAAEMFPGQAQTIAYWAGGAFTSCSLVPGEARMDIQAEGYEPGTCTATIPADGGDAPVICELSPLARVGAVRGEVLDSQGVPTPDAILSLNGPEPRTLVADS